MWVKSEYAGELAVLSAWLAVLLPWNVTYSQFGDLGSTLFVRFPFFQLQYTWLPRIEVEGEVRTLRQTGIELMTGVWLSDPVTATLYPEGVASNVVGASTTWAVGAGVIGLAFLLSLGMYFREERFEAAPVDPVRLMGGLLAVGALVLSVSTYQLHRAGLPGVPIPVGIVVMAVLAGTLLFVERRKSGEGTDPEPAAGGEA